MADVCASKCVAVPGGHALYIGPVLLPGDATPPVTPPQVLEGWYKNASATDKKGLVLVVTAGKEGAVTGGKAFMGVS